MSDSMLWVCQSVSQYIIKIVKNTLKYSGLWTLLCKKGNVVNPSWTSGHEDMQTCHFTSAGLWSPVLTRFPLLVKLGAMVHWLGHLLSYSLNYMKIYIFGTEIFGKLLTIPSQSLTCYSPPVVFLSKWGENLKMFPLQVRLHAET